MQCITYEMYDKILNTHLILIIAWLNGGIIGFVNIYVGKQKKVWCVEDM